MSENAIIPTDNIYSEIRKAILEARAPNCKPMFQNP